MDPYIATASGSSHTNALAKYPRASSRTITHKMRSKPSTCVNLRLLQLLKTAVLRDVTFINRVVKERIASQNNPVEPPFP